MTTNLPVRDLERGALPIVDVGGLSSPDRGTRARVAATLEAACVDKGFLYITGHGIAPGLQDAVFAQAKAFFDLGPDGKAKVTRLCPSAIAASSPCGARPWKRARRPT